MNAYLNTVFDCFIDKSLLKCLVVNDNVNNVKLSYDVVFYVTLFVAAIFCCQFFGLTGATGPKALGPIWLPQCQYDLEAHLGHIITCIYFLLLCNRVIALD